MLLILGCLLGGCAFGHQGRGNTGFFGVKIPNINTNTTKGDIIQTFGIPDSYVVFNETEYWRYRHKSGWYIFPFGKTVEKNLVIEFRDNKVIKSYLMDNGSSFGLIIFQGAVAN